MMCAPMLQWNRVLINGLGSGGWWFHMGLQLHGSCRGKFRGLVRGVAHRWMQGLLTTA